MPNRLRSSTRRRLQRLRRLRSAANGLAGNGLAAARGIRAAQRTRATGEAAPETARVSRFSLSPRSARAARWLTPPLLLAIFLLAGAGYIRQRLDVEGEVRRHVLPALQKQLGTRIEVGRIESDYLSRVTLHDLVIGRNAALPVGALLRAKTVRLDLDLIGLALRRAPLADNPLLALRRARLVEPQIYVERDAQGRLNWQRLFGKDQTASRARWSGTVEVRGGRAWIFDRSVRAASGQFLVAEARDVNGQAVFNGQAATTFAAQLPELFLGAPSLPAQRSRLRNVSLRGEAGADGQSAALDVRWPSAPAPLLADYLFARREVVAHAGTIGGEAQIAWNTAAPFNQQLLIAGNLELRGVTGFIAALAEPGAPSNASAGALRDDSRNATPDETSGARPLRRTRPLLLQNINGPLSFSNGAFATSNLSLRALDTPLRLAGSLALPDAPSARTTQVSATAKSGTRREMLRLPVFDVTARSEAFDTMRLSRLWSGPLAVQGGRARGTVRAWGDTQRARISADVTLPDFALRHPQGGVLSGPLLRAIVQTDSSGRAGRVQLRAGDFSWRQAQAGTVRGRRLQTSADFAQGPRGARVNAAFDTLNFDARRGSDWMNGQSLRGTLRFAGSNRTSETFATFAASGLAARYARHSLRARELRGTLRYAAGSRSGLDAVLSAPHFAWTQTSSGPAGTTRSGDTTLSGRLRRGQVHLTGGAGTDFLRASRVVAAADIAGFSAREPRLGAWRGESLRGRVRLNNAGAATPDFADVSLSRFTAHAASGAAALRYGVLRAQMMRVVAQQSEVSTGAAQTRVASSGWQGAAAVAGLDAGALDLAALSPEAARRVRNAGTLTGSVRFASAGSSNPSAAGAFRLTRATIEEQPLRDIRGRAQLNDGVLRLTDVRAQSNLSALAADASFDLRSGASALSLRAPRVALNARQINPYLASMGIAVDGTATGRLVVAAGGARRVDDKASARSGLARAASSRDESDARGSEPVTVSFDLALPRTGIRSLNNSLNNTREQSSGGAAGARRVLMLGNSRLRGSGALLQESGGRWRFTGDAALFAARAEVPRDATQIAGVVVPAWLRGSRLQNTRIAARGSIARGAAGVVPRIAGTVEIAQAVMPLPVAVPARMVAGRAVSNRSSPKVELLKREASRRDFSWRDARAIFQLAPQGLEVPRFFARAMDLSALPPTAPPRPVARNGTQHVTQTSASGEAPADLTQSAAQVSGHFAWRRGGIIAGQAMAQRLDMARLHRLVMNVGAAPSTLSSTIPAVRGIAFVRADIGGTMSEPRAQVQARLYNGGVITSRAAAPGSAALPVTIPIDAARLEFALSPSDWSGGMLRRLAVDELTWWSRGGRLSASGTVTRQGRSGEAGSGQGVDSDELALDFAARLDGVRLRDAALVANWEAVRRDGDLDGLLSGEMRVAGTLSQPRVEGRAALRLAQAFGLSIAELTAQVGYRTSSRGPLLQLIGIAGQVEGAALRDGVFNLDLARRTWSAKLQTTGAATDRLLRVVAREERNESLAEARDGANGETSQAGRTGNDGAATPGRSIPLPLRGTLRASIDVSGVVRTSAVQDLAVEDNAVQDEIENPTQVASAQDASPAAAREGGFALVPQDGHIEITTDALRWRGRRLGALRADFTLRDGLAHSDLALFRSGGTDENGADENLADERDTDQGAGNRTNQKPENGAPFVRVTGNLPTSLDDPSLDATLHISGERLPVVREALTEIQHVLRERGQKVPNFDQIVLRARALPPSLQGLLMMDARLTGSWSAPVVAIDAKVRQAQLGAQPLPAVDAALTFDNGVIEVRDLALRQTFAPLKNVRADSPARAGAASGAAVSGAADEDERETVLRIAPGGRIVPDGDISLDAEVLNANLSQLASWLPDLREASGRPMIDGELSLFTFQVRGKTQNPSVVGSIEAQELAYRGYTLDRLRVSRFDIDEGQLRIEPGNLTFVKGGFQSSSAWGRLPWSWGDDDTMIGPRRDAPLEVHLPLQTRDFGALSGALVPALSNVDARSFRGLVNIAGTLDAPQVAGEVNLEGARFRVDPAAVPFDFGVADLSGTLRFVEGNRLQIEGLRGRLASAADIRATATNNPPASARDPRAARRVARQTETKAARIAGAFGLSGSVALDLDPQNFVTPGLSLAAHRYDLNLELKGGEYSSENFSGLRDVALQAAWKTGAGEARRAQNLRWNLSAAGRAGRKNVTSGQLRSVATVTLAPDFALGSEAFLRSRFDGDITMRALPFDVRDVGRGVLDGGLRLDNERDAGTTPRGAPLPLAQWRPAKSELQIGGASSQSVLKSAALPKNLLNSTAVAAPAFSRTAPFSKAAASASVSGDRLRVAGTVVLSQAEAVGVPAVGEGSGGAMPDGPLMDVRFVVGRDVRFVTPTLRAEFTGALDVAGTPRDPIIVGSVATRDGQIRFPSASARITEGEISVNVTRDPMANAIRSRIEIDATAIGQVGRYRITLNVRGPLDVYQRPEDRGVLLGDASGNFSGRLLGGAGEAGAVTTQNLRVNVTSDPPLSQDEAFAQLTGTSVRDLQQGGGRVDTSRANEAYARAVVSLLSAPLFSGLERSLEQALGLSSLTLDYRFDEPLSVQAGKAFGDRVYVTYRRSLSDNRPGQSNAYSLRVDYRIKGGLQLGLQTDQRGRQQVTLEKAFRF